MKKQYFLWAAILLSLTACKENLSEERYPAATGDEIMFTGTHGDFTVNGPDTKTIYGNRNGNVYPIYWENGDQIAIYCPEASAPETKEVHYQVNVDNATSTTGTLAKVNPGSNGLIWGEGDMHNFYSIYPADAIKGVVNQTTVKCTIPVLQAPEKIEKQADGVTWMAYPDMDYAYMYAHSVASRINDGGQPVTLDFKPLVTTLEITVNGPVNAESYQISQIMVRSSVNISGEFHLTIGELGSAEDGACTPVDNGTVNTLVTIPISVDDGTGQMVPLTLKTGEKLVVKAFMLPYSAPEKSQTAVTINMVGQGSNTKILSTADIQAQKINVTNLPALKGTDFYYWMSAMDENTYFSQLSIPGSHNSYSYNSNVTGSNTVMSDYQKLSIEEQFKAGARAFSFMVGFQSDSEANDAVKVETGTYLITKSSTNWNNNYDMYIWDGNTVGEEFTKALDSYVAMLDGAISSYKDTYKRTCQEFIVLNINFKQLRDNGTVNGVPEGKYLEVKRWIREVDRILDSYTPSSTNGITLETNLNANSTIGDLKGKIIIFVNYQCPDLPYLEGKVDKVDGVWGADGEEYAGFTFDPTTDATSYIFLRNAYDASSNELISAKLYSSNDRDINYPYYMIPGGQASGITIWKQHLERLNNPLLNVPAWTDNSRVDTKVQIAKDFFQQAINNNIQTGDAGIKNWHMNNLGGFCVVDDNQSYNLSLGQSGNTVTEANVINGAIYNYLADHDINNGPIGIVFMNFYGCSQLQNNGVSTNVYGTWLPQTIMENNFRFELKCKTPSADGNYISGGNIIE